MSALSVSKPKRKNSEKRKEKSRNAARNRRSQESEYFTQLGQLLPLNQNIVEKIDKASIVRLTITYLKIRQLLDPIKNYMSINTDTIINTKLQKEFRLKTIEGFMLILSEDGDMIYLSENVDEYLGLKRIDLIGNSIYDYSHPCDHKEIKEILTLKSHGGVGPYMPFNESILVNDECIPRSFFIRMKCTLTNKGRNVNLRSASYRVIHYNGKLFNLPNKMVKPFKSNALHSPQSYCLITIGEPMDEALYNLQKPLDGYTFLSRHSLDMKFTFVEENINEFLGYDNHEMIGKSFYKFIHSQDSLQLNILCRNLFSKGQCKTGYYRFLAKRGGHAWVLTHASVISDSVSAEPQSVVCINYVLSGIENQDEITSEEQTRHCNNRVEPISNFAESPIIPEPIILESLIPESLIPEPLIERTPSPPISSTKTIFVPRTPDMECGFLMFNEDDNGLTILKNCETDSVDLTHLAPQAGDICVPLDAPDLLPMDIFDDFLLDQNLNDEEKLIIKNQENTVFSNDKAVDTHSCELSDLSITNSAINNGDAEESLSDVLKYSDPIIDIINNIGNSNISSPLNNDPFLSYQYHDDLFSTPSPSSVSSADLYSSSNSPNTSKSSSPLLYENINTPQWDVSKLNMTDNNEFNDDDALNHERSPYASSIDVSLLLNDNSLPSFSSTNIDEIINFDALSNTKEACFGTTNMYDGPNNKSLPMVNHSEVPYNMSSNLALLLKKNQSTLMLHDYVYKDMQLSKEKGCHLNISARTEFSNGDSFPNINNKVSNLSVYGTQNNNRLTNKNVQPSMDLYYPMKNQKRISQVRHYGNVLSDDNLITNKELSLQSNALKRPHQSESYDHLFCHKSNKNIVYSQMNINKPIDSPKRIKANMSQITGTSVLMNLLVNGEDASNGYSKYSSNLPNH